MLPPALKSDKQWLSNSTLGNVLKEITMNEHKDVYHSSVYQCIKLEPAYREDRQKNG